jgi:serine/threonine-protein kinase
VIDKPIGHYQVLARIGAGAVGEVYRGRDTRLNRDVAIKVLREDLAASPASLERFDREAETLAALNHPNIAIVHTVVDRAVIMELVDGEDLSARLDRGPMTLDEALPIARQVAEALGAAHDAGIVHLDLKPANIKLTHSGVVKVLDFGLANAVRGSGPPTDGRPLGTAAYLAPEQARGKHIDKRADVWAFGCVLFEMLTGKQAFAGDDVEATLALVMTGDARWEELQASTPARVRELLRRCLTRNPHLRLRDIWSARLEIDDVIAGVDAPLPAAPPPAASASTKPAPVPAPAPAPTPEPAAVAPLHFDEPAVVPAKEPELVLGLPERQSSFPVVLTVVSVMAGVLIGGAIVWQFARPATYAATEPPAATGASVVQAALLLTPATELNSGRAYPGIGGARTALAWSPDGKTLAFVGRQGSGASKIYIRDVSGDTARALDGTDGAENPAFSPDGQEIAFASAGAIRRTPVAGGAVTKICDARVVNGITWGKTRFVFGSESVLMQVALDSGRVEPLTRATDESVRHASPVLLPGDEAVLFTEHEKRWTSGDERVMAQRFQGGAPALVVPDAADARLLPAGQLAFLRQGTLFVADFDATALKLTGAAPRAAVKDVAQVVMSGVGDDLTLAGQFAVSPTGVLAYVTIPLVSRPDSEMVSVDRSGRVTPLGGGPNTYQAGPSLSPDGSRVAVSITTNQERRPYAFDITRGTLTPLAPSGKAEFTARVWSPANNTVAFIAFEKGPSQFVLLNADNQSAQHVPGPEDFWPSAWSADGKRLAGTARNRAIWIYEPGATTPMREFAPVSGADTRETHPSFSRDGKWLAYGSNVSGRPEVYVRPYPGPGTPIRVSANGGTAPAWSRDGRELYYVATEAGKNGDRVMMAVNMASPAKPGSPTRLFPFFNSVLRLACNPSNCYAVGSGNRLFITAREVAQPVRPVERLNLILNWLDSPGR